MSITREWINKSWFFHSVVYYSTIKKARKQLFIETLLCATHWDLHIKSSYKKFCIFYLEGFRTSERFYFHFFFQIYTTLTS